MFGFQQENKKNKTQVLLRYEACRIFTLIATSPNVIEELSSELNNITF